MASEESYRRILEALRVEKKKHWGKIREIEDDLGLANGYLAKVCAGKATIPTDRLLRVLERMGVGAGRFFANALDVRLDNDSLLEEIERGGEVDRQLARIEEVVREVELSGPPGPAPRAVDAEAMVADLVTCNGREQRRRLGSTRKYRHPAFAAAYLEHLDTLRYDRPRLARLNAETVALKLVPRLPGLQPERIALLLKAIGVVASCHRRKGKWSIAARALRLALGIARRHRLLQILADLLQRGACVLSDNGRIFEAMSLLDEALVVYVDTDSQESIGMVMVERATAFLYLGRYDEALTALERSLTLLQCDSPRLNRNRMVAYQVLGLVHQELGDLDRAEVALARAVEESRQVGRLNQASLLWDHGALELKRSFFGIAEVSLRRAVELFDELKDPTSALVALDLTDALLSQGKDLEAVATAMTMARFLGVFRGNPVAEAAISDLTQRAIQGNLNSDAIDKARRDLESALERQRIQPAN